MMGIKPDELMTSRRADVKVKVA